MARNKKENNEQEVHIVERILKSGIRFYLTWTQDGKQVREGLTDLPLFTGEKYKRDRKGDVVIDKEGNKVVSREYDEIYTRVSALKDARLTEIRNGKLGYIKPSQRALKLGDYMQEQAEGLEVEESGKEGINRHTYSRKLLVAKQSILDFTGGKDIPIVKVDKGFLIAYIDWLEHGYKIQRYVQNAGKHLSSATANERYKAVVYALKRAEKAGIIAGNPANLLDKDDKIDVVKNEREFLTGDELKQLEATPTAALEMRRVYLFMCYTGLRISDAKSLRWGNIRLENGGYCIRKRQQKTEGSVYIPLPTRAVELLPERGTKKASEIVFDNLPTEPSMNRSLKKWALKAGIDKNLTLHTARHTYATFLINKKVEIKTVSKLLGHKKVATTEIYAKLVDKTLDDAVKVWEE